MIKTCKNCKYKDIDYFNEYPCCECNSKSRWEQWKDTNYRPTMKDLMIEELEKIKAEIKELKNDSDYYEWYGIRRAINLIDKHISELEGENKENEIMDKQAGWNEYKDIKETLESLLDKGYTKEMIQTVLEQIDVSELKGESNG